MVVLSNQGPTETRQPVSIPTRHRNRLLAALPDAEVRVLEQWLKPIDLPFKSMIFRAGASIDYIYFPSSGLASAVTHGMGGAVIEVVTVGDEGMLGIPALLGPATEPNEVFMQIAGDALRTPSTALGKVAVPETALFRLLAKYLSAYLYQISQAVACNGLHPVRQRCCRWLLMTHDRVHADELPLTHEFLGVMLGVRRASVTEVLQPLQESGLIRSRRGVITVLDRARLEAESCECYRRVVDEYERLLG
jgi:CRP-like cAMP-binding protein